MAKLTFEYTDSEYLQKNRETEKVTLTIPDDMNLNEFKIICTRLAVSLGYSQSSVDNSFFGKLKKTT